MMEKLHFSQKLPISVEEAWRFFSLPTNLEKITPPSLDFKIKHFQDKEIFQGQLIIYTVKPIWNISCEWVTEITAVQKPNYFIDEQKFGPYSFWHHEHWFTPIPGGVHLEDIIFYKLPYGILGKALNYYKIKADLDHIFNYRKDVLEQLFGIYSLD